MWRFGVPFFMVLSLVFGYVIHAHDGECECLVGE
jgi:hypothetical protein